MLSELVTGRVDAIRVVDHSDTPDDWYYGIEVAATARCSCRDRA